MQKFVKQVMVVGAVVGMGVSVCTTLVSAKNKEETTANVDLTSEGDIQITDHPDNFKFSGKLKGDKQILNSEPIKKPLEVTNPGHATGWNIQASMSIFKNTNGATGLAGSRLFWYPKPVESKSTQIDEDLPSFHDANAGSNGIELKADVTDILQAKPGKGIGVFTVGTSDVKLEIPANAIADNYNATITWSLVDADVGAQTTPAN